MAYPILRRFLFRGAPFLDGAVNLLQRGVVSAALNNIDFGQVQDCFGSSHVKQKDMADNLIKILNHDKQNYLDGIGSYADLVAKQALQQQEKDFGLDVSAWNLDAKRRVFTKNFSDAESHAVIVVSLEPTADAKSTVSDPNLQRMAMECFPGGYATIGDSIFADMVAGGRAIDGTPTEVVTSNWSKILSRNQDLYSRGASVIGTHLLGNNAVIHSVQHDIFPHDTGVVQTALNVTSILHSQHGVVPWTFTTHPSFDGVICTSLHLGSNAVPGGDVVNASIAPSLFKNVFRRTVLLNNNLERLENLVGRDKLSQLLKNPEVTREFREILAHEDFALITDAAILSGLDATGGLLLNELHFFTDTRVSEVDIYELMNTNKCEDFNKLGEEGETTAINSGNLGETGFIRPNESDIVPDLGMLESGVVQNTTEVSTSWGQIDIPPELDKLREKYKTEIEDFAKKIDWNSSKEEVNSVLHTNTVESLQEFELRQIIGNGSDKIAESLLNDNLKSKVASQLANDMVKQLVSDVDFQKFLQELNNDVEEGMQTAKRLFNLELISEKFQSTAMDSYLKERLIAEVSSHKVTLIQNNESEIQKAITSTESNISQTSKEKINAQADLVEVQQKLKDNPPNKSELEEEEIKLQQQIGDLEKEEEALKDQKQEADNMTEENEERRSSEAESSAETYGESVFGGEK